MAIKSDKWIEKMSKSHEMITPYEEKQVRNGKIRPSNTCIIII